METGPQRGRRSWTKPRMQEGLSPGPSRPRWPQPPRAVPGPRLLPPAPKARTAPPRSGSGSTHGCSARQTWEACGAPGADGARRRAWLRPAAGLPSPLGHGSERGGEGRTSSLPPTGSTLHLSPGRLWCRATAAHWGAHRKPQARCHRCRTPSVAGGSGGSPPARSSAGEEPARTGG